MSIKNRLLPIEIKHPLPNWGLVDFRKESSENGAVDSTYKAAKSACNKI